MIVEFQSLSVAAELGVRRPLEWAPKKVISGLPSIRCWASSSKVRKYESTKVWLGKRVVKRRAVAIDFHIPNRGATLGISALKENAR